MKTTNDKTINDETMDFLVAHNVLTRFTEDMLNEKKIQRVVDNMKPSAEPTTNRCMHKLNGVWYAFDVEFTPTKSYDNEYRVDCAVLDADGNGYNTRKFDIVPLTDMDEVEGEIILESHLIFLVKQMTKEIESSKVRLGVLSMEDFVQEYTHKVLLREDVPMEHVTYNMKTLTRQENYFNMSLYYRTTMFGKEKAFHAVLIYGALIIVGDSGANADESMLQDVYELALRPAIRNKIYRKDNK